MLTAGELSGMREAIGNLLPDTCNLLSPTTTNDGQGGDSQTWGTAASSVACRLDILSVSGTGEVLIGGAVLPFTSVKLSVPYSTTITTDYRVEHGGYTYAVKSINTDQSWIAVKRADLERVT